MQSEKLLLCIISAFSVCISVSCSTQKNVASPVIKRLNDSLLKYAHTGIYVYEPAAGKVVIDYQSDKYFTPASNTKIITCYAAMKYLGDSLIGATWIDLDTAIVIYPQGDPSFLHPDFSGQAIVDFIKEQQKPVYISDIFWKTTALGSGWSWDDYSEDYMPERSAFPVYGNVIRWHQAVSKKENPLSVADSIDRFIYSDPEINWPVEFGRPEPKGKFQVERDWRTNAFTINEGGNTETYKDVPFITHGIHTALELLQDSVHKPVHVFTKEIITIGENLFPVPILSVKRDSLLKPMMHRSDNFFAEQLLLMISLYRIGNMNESVAISSMLKNDLKDFPQKPTWADGSGLSRFNLFSPQDFVWILSKMKNEFGMERIRGLFPTAGEGTLRYYDRALKNKLFAKTGSLTGVLSLSGYLQTASGKELVFSVLINNHRQTAASIRTTINEMLLNLYNSY
ncbi:D-alanyl-D-alanine carboxypeptidase/D-alanyl-D-alanine-endopeptidase [Pollutibacter soli]|uniref:D-alanyl-D-alanine carboxypeptidase/D-alanyl-D-alanine endopeptidase n=1 Tax=Pollutibacter soli TaxID=3034157 RepID=UPI0030137DB2